VFVIIPVILAFLIRTKTQQQTPDQAWRFCFDGGYVGMGSSMKSSAQTHFVKNHLLYRKDE
jgi:hypothetical protein